MENNSSEYYDLANYYLKSEKLVEIENTLESNSKLTFSNQFASFVKIFKDKENEYFNSNNLKISPKYMTLDEKNLVIKHIIDFTTILIPKILKLINSKPLKFF